MFAHHIIYLQNFWKVKSRGGGPSSWRGNRWNWLSRGFFELS